MKFRKKPVVIDAVQWNGDNEEEMILFMGKVVRHNRDLIIATPEGDHRASPGDWIIKGVKGEFYPCKPDIFEQTYEIEN
jgi:hypothetical protein